VSRMMNWKVEYALEGGNALDEGSVGSTRKVEFWFPGSWECGGRRGVRS
jgi:hypothetical protein